MLRSAPLLAICAACSIPEDDKAAAPDRAYATQTAAPMPDYRALLVQPSLARADRRERKAAISPPPPDAKAVGELWLSRLQERGALLGHGIAGKGSDGPVDLIDAGLTEAEFMGWAGENGWRVPTHIRWSFVPAMALPPVGEAAKNAIRIWPASRARTGMQHQALFHGRVELRNGCFFVGQFGGQADTLAWFHAEIGLDKDASGYFILRDRISGQTLARLGEEMNWGGPATAQIAPQTERVLREACGPAEIYVVGSPQAKERMLTQYPHLRTLQSPPPPPADAR